MSGSRPARDAALHLRRGGSWTSSPARKLALAARAIPKGLARQAGVRRRHVAATRMCCERIVLSLALRQRAPRPRILCYHAVGTPEWGVNDVSPAQFRRHIDIALAEGYTFAPAAEVARHRAGPRALAITFDDGLASVAQAAAPILAEYGIPWSVYIVSSWADGQHPGFSPLSLGWREIERLAAAGAMIGSHSATHPNFAALTRDQALAELVDSREMIRARTGIEPHEFAIPFGQSSDWDGDLSVLARGAGYDLVYAQSEARRPPGTIPRTFVTRFDGERAFRAALRGAFDRWEEWR